MCKGYCRATRTLAYIRVIHFILQRGTFIVSYHLQFKCAARSNARLLRACEKSSRHRLALDWRKLRVHNGWCNFFWLGKIGNGRLEKYLEPWEGKNQGMHPSVLRAMPASNKSSWQAASTGMMAATIGESVAVDLLTSWSKYIEFLCVQFCPGWLSLGKTQDTARYIMLTCVKSKTVLQI